MSVSTSDATLTAAIAVTLSGLLAVTGLDPHSIMFAAAGGVLGEGAAPAMGTIRKSLVFVSSVLAGALIATVISLRLHEGHLLYTQLWALGVTTGFHPLLASFLKSMPRIGLVLRELAIAALKGIGGVK